MLDSLREGDEVWCRGIIYLATSWKDLKKVYNDMQEVGAKMVFKVNLGIIRFGRNLETWTAFI